MGCRVSGFGIQPGAEKHDRKHTGSMPQPRISSCRLTTVRDSGVSIGISRRHGCPEQLPNYNLHHVPPKHASPLPSHVAAVACNSWASTADFCDFGARSSQAQLAAAANTPSCPQSTVPDQHAAATSCAPQPIRWMAIASPCTQVTQAIQSGAVQSGVSIGKFRRHRWRQLADEYSAVHHVLRRQPEGLSPRATQTHHRRRQKPAQRDVFAHLMVVT